MHELAPRWCEVYMYPLRYCSLDTCGKSLCLRRRGDTLSGDKKTVTWADEAGNAPLLCQVVRERWKTV
jgi:hypothetical protein